MNRPYIFCHMMTSLDGKIMGDYMNTPEGGVDCYRRSRQKKQTQSQNIMRLRGLAPNFNGKNSYIGQGRSVLQCHPGAAGSTICCVEAGRLSAPRLHPV